MENSNNLEPKIKLSTKKPINPSPESNSNPNQSCRHHCCHGELVAGMRDERNKCLRATAKEKIKKNKKMKRKDRGEEVEKRCDFVKKKKK